MQFAAAIVARLPEAVYVSFDIDGLDPSLCPHTGTPVPGGLSFHEASALLGAVAQSGRRIVGFDLNEVAPGDGDDEWDATSARASSTSSSAGRSRRSASSSRLVFRDRLLLLVERELDALHAGVEERGELIGEGVVALARNRFAELRTHHHVNASSCGTAVYASMNARTAAARSGPSSSSLEQRISSERSEVVCHLSPRATTSSSRSSMRARADVYKPRTASSAASVWLK